MNVVMACDLGGTSFRVALVDDAGRTLAEHAVPAPSPAANAGEGRSEIDAEAWWDALVLTAGRLAAARPEAFEVVQGIAICGVTRTQVLLDREGELLGPAITWTDTRAGEVAERLRARFGDHPEAQQVNAFHPLARLAWLAEAGARRDPACVLEPKDFLNFRLTGAAASDPVSMARLLAAAEPAGPGGSLLARAGLADAILPPLREPQDEMGRVRQGLAAPLGQLAGIPVFCCSNDTWAAVTGLGAMRPGYAYNLSGTTEVLGLVDRRRASAEGLLSVDWRGLWQLGGPSQNGADTVAWLLGVLGRGGTVEPTIDALLAGPREPKPVLFLPYLRGERVPYWDPDLRGAFLGLNRRHGPTDLAYAVLEGVACLNRMVLERAEAALGREAAEIRFGGGAAANPVWAQIKADICGRPVVVGTAREPGLLGAAIVAWTGLGRFASLDEAQTSLAKVARRFEPDPSRHEAYAELYRLYRDAEAAIRPVSNALAGFRGALPQVSDA